MSAVATAMVAQWQELRNQVRESEKSEHPDITDHHGRVWVWRDGDLYVHDECLAWPRDLILDGSHGLPGPSVSDNPNYTRLCSTCRQGPTITKEKR